MTEEEEWELHLEKIRMERIELEKWITDSQFDEELDMENLEEFSDEGCPVCGGDNIIKEGRCTTCLDCGWSKCSI